MHKRFVKEMCDHASMDFAVYIENPGLSKKDMQTEAKLDNSEGIMVVATLLS
jgi:hypothetical protein